MAANEQPQMFIAPHYISAPGEELDLTQAESAIAEFNGSLLQGVSRRAIQLVLEQPMPSDLFIPKLNAGSVERPADLPDQAIVVALKGVKSLLMSPGLDIGMRLDFDEGTWDQIAEQPTFKNFLEDNKTADKRDKIRPEDAVNLTCAKLGCYVSRFVEFYPLQAPRINLADMKVLATPDKKLQKQPTA